MSVLRGAADDARRARESLHYRFGGLLLQEPMYVQAFGVTNDRLERVD